VKHRKALLRHVDAGGQRLAEYEVEAIEDVGKPGFYRVTFPASMFVRNGETVSVTWTEE